ncbi:MAG: TTC39/IML2 family protein [Balneolales bacterium]|nr:TTC39/IML2 family protein [Balneolales bacterium]
MISLSGMATVIMIITAVLPQMLIAQVVVPASATSITIEDDASFEHYLEAAIESFYQSHWEETRLLLGQLRHYDSDDLRLYFFESMIPFWAYFFGGSRSEDANLFFDYSARAIEKGDRILASTPQDTSTILLLGGLHGYRGLVAASERRFRTAISSGITGHSFTRVLMSMDNDDPNTLMGQGVFEYMIGSIPREGRWIARLAGLSGDVERGFQILEEAARSNSYVRNDAAMFLAYFYEQEGRLNDALRHLRILSERYPDNIIFGYNKARLYELLDEPQRAMTIYSDIAARSTASVPLLVTRSRERIQALQ